MELKNKIISKLQKLTDKATLADVIKMGLIKDLVVTPEGKVSLKFRPSSSVCPLVFSMALEIQKSIKEVEGVKELDMVVIGHQKAEEINNLLI
ncbi:MAG: iron-sulfur cluster assembly protein [Thermodesulfobacteriota bacterium]|nr:iron-sulfur cluster assembly protein [Thermodesulfobacteriota bacterium]